MKGNKNKKRKRTNKRAHKKSIAVAPPEGATTLQSNQNLKSSPCLYIGGLKRFWLLAELPEGERKNQKILSFCFGFSDAIGKRFPMEFLLEFLIEIDPKQKFRHIPIESENPCTKWFNQI